MSKWHIENVLAALRSVLRLLAALVDALDGPEEKKRFASLSSKLQEAEGELVAFRDASPSNEGPAVPSEGSKREAPKPKGSVHESPADDEEDTPQETRPPRP